MYLKAHQDGIILRVKVTPNSSRNALVPGQGDRLSVKLTSPPVEGKANKQLLKFIGKKLGCLLNNHWGHSCAKKLSFGN
jgi:uncharacterized protein (TIGR00251 family)